MTQAYGLTPDPWQQIILDAWLGRGEDDKFTASSCGLSVPRQNGKNALLEMRELYGLTVIKEHILHTAHEVKTARKAFLRLAGFFEDDRRYPELAEMVVAIRRTNGQEAIHLTNGASIEFSARSRGAARGFTVDLVVFDEAQELTDEQLEAMMPTLSASPLGNRQFIYTGTPPGPTTPGTVFGRTRANTIAEREKGLCWHEWSVETVGDVEDRSRWYETNPAMGFRIDEEFTAKELMSMSPEGFARERLGWWASKRGRAIISQEEWDELLTEEPPDDGKLAFGVRFSPDGAKASVAAAIKPEIGMPYIELVQMYNLNGNTDPIKDLLMRQKEQTSCVVIDGKAHVDGLVADLREDKYPQKAIVVPGVNDVIAANTRFLDAIHKRRICHMNQPQLDSTVEIAQKRLIGDKGGWGFDGIEGDDVTPLEAVSLAYWGVMTTKRRPGKKARIL